VRYNAEADPMFSQAAVDLLPGNYCPGRDRTDPVISPLFGNFAGLPPLLFHAGSTEMLLDDSVRAHDRARQAGVEAEIEVWRELPHVFQVFHWIPESRLALQAIADFITSRAVDARPSLVQTAPAYSLEPAVGDGITRQAL
jgi:acetyl esterase/lipase